MEEHGQGMKKNPTFKDIGEDVRVGVVWDTGKFEFAATVTLVEEFLHPAGFGGITDSSSNAVASFEELIDDMAANESANAGNEDERSLWENEFGGSHCICCVSYKIRLLGGSERYESYIYVDGHGLCRVFRGQYRSSFVSCRAQRDPVACWSFNPARFCHIALTVDGC